MCRSIKPLRNVEPTTEDEIRAAARQFVRKVSGFHNPSAANTAAFEQAIDEIAGATGRLLERLPAKRPTSPGREVESPVRAG